ncbi:MAG: acyl-[Eubacterium sp.]|nr:acyl-[acyl-carrier-protein] thioesterase [Eubacterium sp.]
MYSFRSRVRYSELSSEKKLSLVSIINYFQDCCTFEAEDTGVGLKWLKEHNTAWMLTNWQIHIIRRPEYCEEIEIITWACDFRYFIGKRSFLIRTLTGEPLVFALSEWAYVNVVTGVPDRNVPQEEFDAYGMEPPIEKRFEEFGIQQNPEEVIYKGRIDIPDAGGTELPRIVVSGEHLDTNDHVNNAQYVAIASSVLPEHFEADMFRAEYKMQSKLGDILHPVVYKEDENLCKVVLKDEEGNIKLVCAFARKV